MQHFAGLMPRNEGDDPRCVIVLFLWQDRLGTDSRIEPGKAEGRLGHVAVEVETEGGLENVAGNASVEDQFELERDCADE